MAFVFTRINTLNPYKLMNSVISSPNLVKFSTYSKNGPGFGFSHFLVPVSTPLLQNLSLVILLLFFISPGILCRDFQQCPFDSYLCSINFEFWPHLYFT